MHAPHINHVYNVSGRKKRQSNITFVETLAASTGEEITIIHAMNDIIARLIM